MVESTWHIWVIKQSKQDTVISYLDSLPEVEEYLYPTAPKLYKLKSGKVKKKRVPLYSGYLFIKYANAPETFYKLNTFPFITTYVGPCSKSDLEKVDAAKRLEEWNVLSKNVQVDDFVKITSGPFEGFEGKVNAVNGNNVTVSLYVLGRKVNTTFIKDDVDVLKREHGA